MSYYAVNACNILNSEQPDYHWVQLFGFTIHKNEKTVENRLSNAVLLIVYDELISSEILYRLQMIVAKAIAG